MKNIRSIFFCLVFIGMCLTVPGFIFANVVISEVMYDVEGTDTGREWIEIHNIGETEVDLSGYKLFEANVNHKITAVDSALIPAGGFGIIADSPDKFRADNVAFSGPLFDSAFSLTNDGEDLVIRDANALDIDSFSYSPLLGAKGDGASLQKSSLFGWIPALPTPGRGTVATEPYSKPIETPVNDGSGNATSTDATEGQSPTPITSSYSAHSSQSVANISYDEPELAVTSGRPRLGFVGVPLTFEAKVKSIKNVSPGNSVNSVWSLGDGSSLRGQFISHAYKFPGEYNLVLNSDIGGANAVSRVRVKIIEAYVTIASITREYVELLNRGEYELNIGGWIIETEGERFIVPRDTLISSQTTIKIPFDTAGFRNVKEFVRIANPSGTILSSMSVNLATTSIPMVVLPNGINEEEFRRLFIKFSEEMI